MLLFDDFSNYCLANAVEPMRVVNRFLGREAYEWALITLDGQPVKSSAGMPVTPDCSLEQSPGGNVLFVMPGYEFRTYATTICDCALQAASERYDVLAGLDMGSWLLASAGLLDQHRATVHWDELSAFSERFPGVNAERVTFTIDGDRWTSAGAMAAFDLLQYMVGQTHGEAMRLEVAAMFMVGEGGGERNKTDIRPQSSLCKRAVSMMRVQLEEPVSIFDICETLQCRRQSLERAFNEELGAPPKTIYRRIRLTAARRYAEQTKLSVAEISTRCGYHNPSAMTRAFRDEFGVAPRDLRPH
ncbi:MAG: AraC family transcriptional regulator [Rhodobacteraceae bacterium]|nr:MAG: AraC family transcriptional regulator [Paracoccaceae bacterium]